MSENLNHFEEKNAQPDDKSSCLNTGKTQKCGVVLVISYFVLVIVWCCSSDPIFKPLVPTMVQIMSTAGLKQNWALFGPKTGLQNMHHLAKIRFADGTVKLYEWPRVDNVDLLKKGDYEPYSKLFTDNLPNDYCSNLRVSVARFIARANINPANQPRLVTLIDVVSQIPDPFLFYANPVLPPHTEIRASYVYQVQEQDLQ